jgi:hypothetical protein
MKTADDPRPLLSSWREPRVAEKYRVPADIP